MSVPSMITYDSMAKAGLPPAVKSQVRQWYERTLNGGGETYESKIALAKLHARAADEGLRAGGESLLVGVILGTVHAHSRTGLDIKKVPVDVVAGVIGLVAGTFAAQEEVGKDLANAGAACLAIFAFRKSHDIVSEIELKRSGVTAGGGASTGQIKMSKASFGADPKIPGMRRISNFGGEDPVVAAARGL